MNQENTSGGTQPATAPSLLVTQLMENMDTLTKKVSELSQSVANINAASTRDSFGKQRGPVISVVTSATLRVNVRVQGILLDGRIIDNAKQKTIALSVET